MVYDFMHQRMILFVLYGLFHKFHANIAFPAIYKHFYRNCDNRIRPTASEIRRKSQDCIYSVLNGSLVHKNKSLWISYKDTV